MKPTESRRLFLWHAHPGVIMRVFAIPLAIALCSGTIASAAEPPAPKVLILGIDGCRTDALTVAEAPNLHRLIEEGAFARNNDVIDDRATGADTVSGPGWSSILTGVWADKHGVLNNEFKDPKLDKFPNILRLLKQSRSAVRAGAFVNWKPLADHVISADDGCRLVVDGDKSNYVEGDRLVTESAVQFLSESDPDLVFVYLGQVDVAGHEHGFHPNVPEYMAAIQTADRHVGRILGAIEARKAFAGERWLTIVATDHGGRGTGHGGGRDAPEIRKTFLILHGPTIKAGEISAATANVDVAPTALAHLGAPLRPEWKLDGKIIQP
jgi:predicted AlkP superfamily pyrophosphatase or phosphodiesterase